MQLTMKTGQEKRNDFPRINVVDSTSNSYLVEFNGGLYKVTPNYVTEINPDQLSRDDSIDTVVMQPEIFSRKSDIPKSYREVMLFSAIREYERRRATDKPEGLREMVEIDEALYVSRFKDKDGFLHFRRQLRGYEEFLYGYYSIAGDRVWQFLCDQFEEGYDGNKHSAGGFSGGAFMGGFYDTNWNVKWMTDKIKEKIAVFVAGNSVLRDLYEKDGKVNKLGRGLFQKARTYVKKDKATAFRLAQDELKRGENLQREFFGRLKNVPEEKRKDYDRFYYALSGWVYVIRDGIQQGLDPILQGTKSCVDLQKRLEELRKITFSPNSDEE